VQNIYYEYNATLNDQAANKKKKILFRIFGIVSVVFGAVLLLMIFLFQADSAGFVQAVPFLIFLFIMTVMMFVSAFFIRRLRLSINPEFDFVLNGDKVRVVKIVNRQKRKLLAQFDVKSIEAYGKVTMEEGLARFMSAPGIKKKYAVANLDDEDKQYFLCYTSSEGKGLLFAELSEDFIIHLRRAVGRDIAVKK